MTTSCTLPNNASNDSELSAALTSGPLPVTEVWQGVSLYGYKEETNGQVVPVQAGKSELAEDAWRVNFKLVQLGNGTMRGLLLCRADPRKLAGSKHSLAGGGALVLANGLFGGISLIAELATMSRCAQSKNGYIETIIPLNRASNFFGHPRQTLDKNIGFAGQVPSLYAAEKECRMLQGVRFVSIQNSSACVGFSDPYAKKLRFIIIPAGKIRAVKADFEKI